MIWQVWASWQRHWWFPWGVACFLISAFAIWQVKWKTFLVPLSLTYILAGSVWVCFNSDNFAQAPSTMSSLLALLLFLFSLKIPTKVGGKICLSLGLLGFVCAVLSPIYLHYVPESHGPMPLFFNRSMGGVFTVMALAPTPFWPLGGVAAMALGRATPILAFLAALIVRKDSFFWLSMSVIFIGAYLDLHHGLPSDQGRYATWQVYWSWFTEQPWGVQLLGTFLGTTATYLPAERLMQGIPLEAQYSPWLHNDYLQALTEFGGVGGALLVVTALFLFFKAPRQQKAVGAAMGVAMLTDFPWHWMPEAFVFWYWLRINAVKGDYYGSRGINWWITGDQLFSSRVAGDGEIK